MTEAGLFLSKDYGDTFTPIGALTPVTSAAFDPNGRDLFYSYQALKVYHLDTGETTALQTPTLSGSDAISFIAANPVSDQLAFASFSKDIYLSNDNGQSWNQIVRQGIG